MEPSGEQRYMRNPSALSAWRARAAGRGGGSATARDPEGTGSGQTLLLAAPGIPNLVGTAAARVWSTGIDALGQKPWEGGQQTTKPELGPHGWSTFYTKMVQE